MKKTVYLMFSLLIIAAGFYVSVAIEANGNQLNKDKTFTSVQKSTGEPVKDARFKVTMLDVGQGLCVLINADGHKMVYDGGNRENSSRVVAYLRKNNVKEFDYLVASHFDEDHIAGLIGILRTTSVGTAIIPSYTSETKIYHSFMKAVKSAKSVIYAKAGDSYKLGNATVDVLYGCKGDEETNNNKSTVVRVSYGDVACVLTGDAEFQTESYLVRNVAKLGCTLYIVGHHGSSGSSSDRFVKAMRPKVGFISVGVGNKHGHPTKRTLDTLQNNGVEIFRTDTGGTVTFESDGRAYHVSMEGKKHNNDISVLPLAGTKYIINKSSKRFHFPDCKAVPSIPGHNKGYTAKSRKELIDEGYISCGYCKP